MVERNRRDDTSRLYEGEDEWKQHLYTCQDLIIILFFYFRYETSTNMRFLYA